MKPIRWGVLGCGDIVRKRVAAAIQATEGCELTAFCRRDPDALSDLCQQFSVPGAFSDAQELIEHPEVDAVYVATPVHLHAAQTLAAARAGKHVLVEKPMALNPAECRAMIDACEQAGVVLGVAYYRRFYPVIRRLQQLLAEGVLGQVRYVSATTSAYFGISAGEPGYWRVLPQEGGGGALMDIGSHRIDLFQYLFGPIESASGHVATVESEFAAEDTCTASMKFVGGMLGSLHCLFRSELDPDELVVHGSLGRAVISPLNSGRLTWVTQGESHAELIPCDSNFNQPLIEDFVEAIRRGRPPRCSGRDGWLTNQVMSWIYDSP